MTTRLTADEEMTAALARMLAATARPGDTILLDGPVGAGKTHFARAFIRARQGDAAEEVPSPTFTLVQTYDDPMGTEIWHADLYRLSDPSELEELGLDEAMEDAICLIEWPDRMEALPEGALTVSIVDGDGPETRRIALIGGDAARAAERARFVGTAGWAAARVLPLAGDASARRYFRLVHGGDSAVLMDDPAGDCARFAAMTDWLRAHGFGAPEILAADPAAGLLLVEDLGDDLVARVLETRPGMAPAIYERITDLLVDLHRQPVPDFVNPLDGAALADQVGLFAEWYPQAAGASDQAAQAIAPIIARLHAELAADTPPALSLRDFHAENLIWRGTAPLGLIDYQDAVACHPAYDLVSALQDARRNVAPAIEAACIARYLAATGLDEERFRAAYALLGAQRNLRIMGIFTRLCLRDGKTRYLEFMPRVWGHIRRDLSHPALAPLAEVIATLPAPDAAIIERIRRQCAR
ncbi:tRNA (adenosine(37)-N6)-threonylcarbamoyltransferase complex ATPase subunit type 1 TsaE [Paracoccus marinaquae]|uniref:tRNA (Adenosine(37)-N6)-threonylcarbamoyltransferase complex ATPase subunit type 1 TsaE n=1 Tax=Paracoccus marinaquae TaxID=2841926 RepID=A0ABS6AGW5_9RHOB|nr:tRNA (adenosine(37)-N6)-threonylcarbamoyltransferase complex ATPase subunit type 1 TsaE [Paracoccus marinaquae]MBU3028884.1 tRNA (adenosine(37)-N6)-threonylcarbamoyltransferase complex ATPase subunit type 1 TsaE [Paracoccus marinaquae]